MILPLLLALLTGPSDSILGRWDGTSTCVKASWNAACHDEVVRYDAVRSGGDTIVVHAYKQVGTGWDWMGDLALTYDGTARRWAGEWSNGRVHIEWSFWLVGAELHGQVVTLPDRRKARDVVVHRAAAG
jgi:hypothetical protein